MFLFKAAWRQCQVAVLATFGSVSSLKALIWIPWYLHVLSVVLVNLVVCVCQCPWMWLFVQSGVAWSRWSPERLSRQNCECCRSCRCSGSPCQHILTVLLWLLGDLTGHFLCSQPDVRRLLPRALPSVFFLSWLSEKMWFPVTYWEDWSVWTRGHSSWTSCPYVLCHYKPPGSPLSAGAASFG